MEPTEDENRPPADQPSMPVQPVWVSRDVAAYQAQYQSPYAPQAQPYEPANQPPYPPRLPRTQALAFVQRLKRGTLWFSLAGFAALVGLAASHATGVTAAQSTSPTTQPSGTGNDESPTNQQGGGFFGDPGDPGNNGNSGSFGSSGGSQAPVSGSSVS